MAFCKKCGTQLPDNSDFCPACGAPTKGEETKNSGENFTDKLNNTPDFTASMDQTDINNNKIMAIFAYLGPLVLIPLLGAKDSKFARFHANQGLILLIAEVIISVVSIIPILGWIVASLGGIVIFVLTILGIINVANGKAKEIPLIGKYKIIN